MSAQLHSDELLSIFLDLMKNVITPEQLQLQSGLPIKRCAEILTAYHRLIGKKD